MAGEKLVPGRYGVLIEAPTFSMFGEGLKQRVEDAYKWLTDNGGTVERHELKMSPSGVFVIALLPRPAVWPFDFGDPPRLIDEAVQDSHDFDPSLAEEGAKVALETKKKVDEGIESAVDFASGMRDALVFLAVCWFFSKRK